MLKKNNTTLFFILFFTFKIYIFNGQIVSEKKSLLSILTNIEEIFEVRFSYASENINGIFIVPPSNNLTLTEKINYLNNQTPLLFSQLDSRFITIVLKNENDKYCGIIMNEFTGEILEGAHITSFNDRYSTSSNQRGNFYLPTNIELEKIRISYLGYKDIIVPVSKLEQGKCIELYMQLTISELDQVYISSYFTKGIEKQFNGSTTITTDQFGLLPGQIDNDVLKIIQVIPGIESVDETASNINIRGGSQNENLVLWDDIKMYQNGHFFGLISAYNPDLTQHVTVYKNGTSSRYGEGVSGVIDMKSKNSLSDSFTGIAGFNLINLNAYFNIPITSKIGVQLSGRKSINQFFESSVYKSYADRIFQDTEITNVQIADNLTPILTDEDFNFYDFSAKLLCNFSDKDKLRINFLTIKNSLDFTEVVEESSLSKTSNLKQESIVGGISWARNWSKKTETIVFAYGSSYDLKSTNKDILTTQEILQENEVLETGLKLDANLIITEKIKIKTGFHYSETGIANTQDVNLPRFRFYEKNVIQSYIAFGDLVYKPKGNNTILNLGIRSNYYSKVNSFLIEPRLSLHQKLAKGFAIEILGEFKSQTTTQRIDFQSDFLGIEKRRWILANNENIPIIKSKQASIGLLYNKNNWFINLEGYYKNVEGITSSNQGFQNQFQYVKTTGKYNVKGAEFTLHKKLKSFSYWLSYNYSKNDYNFEELTPSEFLNNVDIKNSFTIASTYNYNNFKVSLGIQGHNGKPYTVPVKGNEIIIIDFEEFINYDLPNAERLPNYFRANFSTEYLWDISENVKLKFNFAILNLLNTKNTLNTRYVLIPDENGNSQVNRIDEISLGITPNFSFQVLF